jgi:hypothetical protein
LPDPSRQLQAIYLAGFGIESFERFPRAVGVTRGSCIVFLETTADGLRMIGQPGWQLGEAMGVLVERCGKKVFQAKAETVEATPQRLIELERFTDDLTALMTSQA